MEPVTPAEAKRARSNAKGQLTRVVKQLVDYYNHPLKYYNVSSIDRHGSQIHKHDVTFLEAHEIMYPSPDRSDAYYTELNDHQEVVDNALQSVEQLKLCVQARTTGLIIKGALTRLRGSVEAGYASSHQAAYGAVETLITEYDVLKAEEGVHTNPGVVAMAEEINELWFEIEQIRTDSGYTPPAPAIAAVAAPAATPHPPSEPRMPHLPVVLPTFDGKTTEYRTFKKLFMAVMSRQRHLNEEEKKAHLMKCMTQPRAKELTRQAINQGTTLDEAMALLSRHFENPQSVVAYHLNQYYKLPPISQNKKDLMEALRYLSDHADGIVEAGCLTSGQVLVAYMDGQFSKELRTLWRATYKATDKPPDLAQLREFLITQEDNAADILVNRLTQVHQTKPPHVKQRSSTKHHNASHVKRERSPSPSHSPTPRTAFVATRGKACVFCKEAHNVFSCAAFKAKAPQERQEWAKTEKRCFNCLGDRHLSSDCKSTKRCQECNSSHHTLLHLPAWRRTPPQPEANDYVATSVSSRAGAPLTALADVSAGKHTLTARVLLDTGAEVTLVSREFANSLRATKLNHSPMKIGGMGSVTSPYAIRLSLHGNAEMGKQDETVQLNARVLEQIPQPTSTIPKRSAKTLAFLEDVPLADPDYGPGAPVDIILDNSAWYLCRTGSVRQSTQRGVMADSTIFGWVVGGNTLAKTIDDDQSPQVLVAQPADTKLNSLIEQQWLDPELPGDASALSLEDARAEQTFQETHRQLPDGRHEVGMPTIEDPPPLGESRRQAVQRYRSVQRSMIRKGQWDGYREAVLDFVKTGHAERVPDADLKKPNHQTYYMPMHGVCKSGSTSTRIRPVCDASAITSTGVSYNDTLATGPCSYHPLPSILIRFRDAAVAMTADVSKMYRQVSLRLEDRDFHRFVFELESGSLADFRMTRVTFGVKSSPFVATRLLQQIATDQQSTHPIAAKIIQTSFYVDDVLTGAQTVEQALVIRKDLNEILDSGRLPLCKWRSNSTELLSSIPQQLRELSDLTISSSPSDSQKALGIHWCTSADDLHISTPTVQSSLSTTKRQMVSVVAQVYDPLGWFSPAIMLPRILIQQAWTLKSKWDDNLPNSILLTWHGWLSELPALTLHPVHRPYGAPAEIPVCRELHGFSDASEQGFGGVVYLKSVYESGGCTIDLVAAKGKVAPLRPVTVPRLELKGAVVLSNLLATIAKDLDISNSNIHAWSDSTIILGWVRHPPSRLAVYVGNRVRHIQDTIPTAQWRHTPGSENPADCLSRGLRPEDLCQFSLWWKGPDWLLLDSSQWPQQTSCDDCLLPEMRKIVQITQPESLPLSHGQTSFAHWVRVVAWMRRFWNNYTHPQNKLTNSFLSSDEYQAAHRSIIRASQRLTLGDTLLTIQAGNALPKTNPFRRLSPLIDHDGILKVGGRLSHSDLPETAKHPTILSGKDPLVRLMIDGQHQRMLHPPISATMATLSFSFHIPRLKPILKAITSRCLVCQRKWAHPVQQRMGDLPSVRCSRAQVFESVGVDYAGPLFITQGRGRGYSRVKTYVALFICMLTRAVHLELASDCSTSAFLAALDRFCSRRGTPSQVFSDNGGNFKGGNAELQAALSELHSTDGAEQLCRWSTTKGLTWHFQPAYSPNFGGLWEAGVKAMKLLLRDTLYHLNLHFDELNTLLISAESIMNSRPYLPLHATDPDGLCPLTPGHFLVGRPLCALPQRVDVDAKLQNVRRWELVKRLQYEHWTQFKKIFLPHISSRARNLTAHQNLKINDVVLLSNLNTRRNSWPLGLIVAVYPGPDGLVRAADVRVETSRNSSARLATTVYRRSVRHLVRMPIQTAVETEESTD